MPKRQKTATASKTDDGSAVIDLPPPGETTDDKVAAMSVFSALQVRRTIRDISDVPLSLQTVSNVLWAAAGVNRPVGPFHSSGRTAASASNSQEIDLYVAKSDGLYLYEPLKNQLVLKKKGDHRSQFVRSREMC